MYNKNGIVETIYKYFTSLFHLMYHKIILPLDNFYALVNAFDEYALTILIEAIELNFSYKSPETI